MIEQTKRQCNRRNTGKREGSLVVKNYLEWKWRAHCQYGILRKDEKAFRINFEFEYYPLSDWKPQFLVAEEFIQRIFIDHLICT